MQGNCELLKIVIVFKFKKKKNNNKIVNRSINPIVSTDGGSVSAPVMRLSRCLKADRTAGELCCCYDDPRRGPVNNIRLVRSRLLVVRLDGHIDFMGK